MTLWHPNTQMREWNTFDEIVKGEGIWLVDSQGYRMADAVASMWCNVWGHSEPALIQAIQEQSKLLQHCSLFNLTHAPAERLAGYMVERCPGMRGVFYSDNGSTAMEAAFKMAVQYWDNQGHSGRNIIAGLQGGYHGDTLWAMSVGYSPGFFDRFSNAIQDAVQIVMPQQPSQPEDWDACLDDMARWFEDTSPAALAMESGAQVAGGAIVYPDRFQARVYDICRRNDVLLIADEVATGMGRMGAIAEYDRQNAKADIVSYSKMLTGGYLPMAATLSSDAVYEAFLGGYEDNRHLFHGHTYTGNPMAAAVACRNLELYDERNLLGHVHTMSGILRECLDELVDMDIIYDIRCGGLLAGIQIDDSWSVPGGVSANRYLYEAGRRRGIYLRTLGKTILVVPPLCISEEELRFVMSGVGDILGSLLG